MLSLWCVGYKPNTLGTFLVLEKEVRVMQVITDQHTTEEIKSVLSGQTGRPKYVRIFISGYG